MCGRKGLNINKRIGIFLASTAIIFLQAHPGRGETAAASIRANQTVSFSIPPQNLAGAVNAFISATGWQVAFSSGLLDNKRSNGVQGDLTPQVALQRILAGSGISIRMNGADMATLVAESSGGQADGTTVLPTIQVSGPSGAVELGSGDPGDSGTTSLSGGQLAARTDGNDANGVLKNLPNVQYQNDIDDNAGATNQSVIDLKPREVSISGARVYENNVIVEGMEINDVTGSQESEGSEELPDDDSQSPPNLYRIYGLHSQTVYIPSEFLEKATVIDSNASAKYGNFQGGVVSYQLNQAKRDRWHASASLDFSSSRWTGYTLGTEDGENPNGYDAPEYLKRRLGVTVTGPLADNISVLGQYSRQTAVTEKQKAYRYLEEDSVEQDALKQFYRGQIKAETDYGDFTLDGIYNSYDQYWESAMWRNLRINMGSDSSTTKLEHQYDFGNVSLGGLALENVKLESRVSYGTSDHFNHSNSNVANVFKQASYSGGRRTFESSELDWCRTDPSITTGTQYCYDGGIGNLEQGQQTFGWNEELCADLAAGSIRLGSEYKFTDAYRRRPEDFTYYTTYTTKAQAGVSGFTCNTSEACSSEQYASTKAIYRAFDVSAQLNQLASYGEVEQSWKWLTVRAGARATWDDYMNNLDIAPRFVATLKPYEDLAFTFGANRYYDGQSLAYAIRAEQPKAQTYTRTASSGVVSDIWTARSRSTYTNEAAGLKTPYTDELSLAINGKEPLFGGDWRLRFLDRRAKDQYATQTSGDKNVLTNGGSGAYQSISAEYSKELDTARIPKMEQLFFNASVTWAQREVSNDSYFDDSLEEDYIWYRNKSYTKAGFNVVTGNMDIPLRLQSGLSSVWMDGALELSVAANYNFGYTGARDTETSVVVNGISHEVYEDFDFDPTLTVDLAASYKVVENDVAGLSLTFKVDNVFNEIGNAASSDDNPWIVGRTVWVGARATF
ncbi:TonB-dependent receptor [Allorhizobium undicola]|uniref:TonB-dependent receptor n=1 Tax=Allorhizobium undicola TaxID=78527 RepID=UPI000488398E|nr:TonB-dependent receptor [Allorhizobium undicola]